MGLKILISLIVVLAVAVLVGMFLSRTVAKANASSSGSAPNMNEPSLNRGAMFAAPRPRS